MRAGSAAVVALRVRVHRRRRAVDRDLRRALEFSNRPGSAPIPGFVIAIFVSLFVSFNVFAANMVLQYEGSGPGAITSTGAGVHAFQPVRQVASRLAGLLRTLRP